MASCTCSEVLSAGKFKALASSCAYILRAKTGCCADTTTGNDKSESLPSDLVKIGFTDSCPQVTIESKAKTRKKKYFIWYFLRVVHAEKTNLSIFEDN